MKLLSAHVTDKMKMMRYHIQLNKHRTTVLLDQIIAELLAIKLDTKPGTKEHLPV